MSEAWIQAENERRLANMVRIGAVSSVDASNARVQVDIGGVETDWLPWLTGRAGATKKWSCPTVGEQVLVISPYGDTLQAVVLTAIYSDANAPPSNDDNVEKVIFRDGTTISYDVSASALTVNCVGAVVINCTNATVKASSVKVDSPQTTCTGSLTVQGLLTFLSGMAGSNSTGGACATINGNVAFGSGSLTHDGKNIGASHTHPDPHGGNTGGVNS